MTDLEISKALALAIGWSYDQIFYNASSNIIEIDVAPYMRVFDYRDWNVIGPIAEKFDAFPTKVSSGAAWANIAYEAPHPTDVLVDTAQKAIAMAVIQGAGK